MKKLWKSCLIAVFALAGLCIVSVGIMFFTSTCPPQGPWPMPPWCVSGIASPAVAPKMAPTATQPIAQPTPKPIIITVNLTVTVPYWTQGDVYLGVGDNAAYLKLEKVNEVTYKGTATLDEGVEYYYSRGTLETKSINTFKTTDLPKGLNAVVDWSDSQKQIARSGFQKGVTFGGMLWRPEELSQPGIIEHNLDLAKDFGVEWIAIIPDWFIYPDLNSSAIRPWYASDGPFPNSSGWVTPTLNDEQIEAIIQKARARGMKIMLKPHVDPIDWSPQQPKGRGDIQPSDWDAWYSSYTSFILRYAELADGPFIGKPAGQVIKKWYQKIED